MSDEGPSREEIKELDKKQLRKRYPSGWMRTARFETNVFVIDALLESPPHREFTTKELADEAGVSERSVSDHVQELVDLGLVTELPDRDRTRYQLNQHSPIVRKIYELNTTVARVNDGDLERSVTPPSTSDQFGRKENTVSLSGSRSKGSSFTPGDSHAY